MLALTSIQDKATLKLIEGDNSPANVTSWSFGSKVFQEHNSKRMANVADREAAYLAQTAQLKAEGFSKEKEGVQEWEKAGSEYHKLLAQVNSALSLKDGSKSTVQFPPFTKTYNLSLSRRTTHNP